MEALFITWNAQGLSNLSYLPRLVDDLGGSRDPSLGVIICLQEVSLPQGCDLPNKIGRRDILYCGTDAEQSGNQRCNTAIMWEKEKFTRQDRHAKYYGNRYWECIKLRANGNGKEFWVMSVHGPAGGPPNYAHNGEVIGSELHTFARERVPLIALGDMNCQPGDMRVSGNGSVISCGHVTRPKSNAELDFMVIYEGLKRIECAGVVDVGVSDHRGVGFRATI